jgi:hypothetical protein
VGALIVTVQVDPVQVAGSQAAIDEDAVPAMVSLTVVPASKFALMLQLGAWQLIPVGFEMMVVLPCPAPIARKFTVNAYCSRVNVAVTVVAALSVTVHEPVPLHPPPDHPANVEVESGAAVSVTVGVAVVRVKPALQVLPQLIAVVVSCTVPPPVPFFDTVSDNVSSPVPESVTEGDPAAPPLTVRVADFAP